MFLTVHNCELANRSYSYLWFDIWHWQWWLQLACMLLTITRVLNYMSHPPKRNGVWSSSVILLSVPVAFCNLLQCLCSLSHFNITVLLQFELQDKVLFHFVGLTYWIAHVSRYLLCFVLSMNYLGASKIENGLQDVRVLSLSLSAISVRCLIWSASVERHSPRLGLGGRLCNFPEGGARWKWE